MNARERSTTLLPRYIMTRRPLSVTSATAYAFRFSHLAIPMNLSASDLSTPTAMRSWDSEIAISVGLSPAYLSFTSSRLMTSPSASSPIATHTPPAPKSLHFFIILVTSGFLKRRWIFLSSGAFPFWTSAAHVVREESLCSLLEPVAPPIPSLPVSPPSRIMTSPGVSVSLLTSEALTAPTTAPSSRCFAT